MKLSLLIKTLKDAKKKFGDVPVNLMDGETGDYHPLHQVLKIHPHTYITYPSTCARGGRYWIVNRDKPVESIALTRHGGNSADIVLATED